MSETKFVLGLVVADAAAVIVAALLGMHRPVLAAAAVNAVIAILFAIGTMINLSRIRPR